MRCAYCFYLAKSVLYPESPRHRMTLAVLERLVSSYMELEQDVYSFGWQGGEPTLMGLAFFQEVVRLQQKHGRQGCVVANGLQTNATLIDDALARHFARYRFLLGVSLDGPADLHDTARQTVAGHGTHAQVLQGIETLRRNTVEFNILTAVQSAHQGRGREVYRYLWTAVSCTTSTSPSSSSTSRASPFPSQYTPRPGESSSARSFSTSGS